MHWRTREGEAKLFITRAAQMRYEANGSIETTEKHTLKQIVEHYKLDIGCIYDCGSRDAKDGIELAEMFLARELHIFECNPASAEVCRSNSRAAHFKGAIVVNEVALSDQIGQTTFYAIDTNKTISTRGDGNVGASSMFRASPAYKKERYVQYEVTVPTTTLAEYFKNHCPPNLLWMDLQGAELLALKGAGEQLRQVQIIHLEVGFRRMYVGQPLYHDINAFLANDFERVHVSLGRWPRLLWLYRALKTGPWVANAIYINKALTRRSRA